MEEKNNEEIPAIFESDDLVRMAEYAEKRVTAIKRIKKAALAVTSIHDWTDQHGKPYLNASGAEKIARLFGISWRIDEPEYIKEEDGHFSYVYKGYFSLGSITIEAIGSRSSRDPFFSKSHEEDIPPSEIDRNDVRKAAYTNLLGNGITRLLGIRNLTWDDLKNSEIEQGKVARVEYRKKEMKKDVKELRDKIGYMLLEMAGNDKKEAGRLLEEFTSFVAKDGSVVKGKNSLTKLSEQAIPVTYGKVKEAYQEWKKETEQIEKDFEEHEKKLKKGAESEQGSLINQ